MMGRWDDETSRQRFERETSFPELPIISTQLIY